MKKYNADKLCIDFLNETKNREYISSFIYSFYEAYDANKKYEGFLPVLIPKVNADRYGNFNISLTMLQAHQGSMSVERHLIFELNKLAKHFLH